MSEGGDSGDSSGDEGAESLEDAMEESSQENSGGSPQYAEKSSSSKSSKSSKKSKGSKLEKLADNDTQELVTALIEKGATEEEAHQLINDYKSKKDRKKEYSHERCSLKEFAQRIRAMDGKSILGGIKGMFYLALALSDPGMPDRDPYKDIEDGAYLIYIPGYLSIHKDHRPLEESLGKKVVFLDSYDADELQEVVNAIKSKHGRVGIMAFSDGGKFMDEYLAEKGDDNIDHIWVLDSNPLNAKSGKVSYINARNSWLRVLEKPQNWTSKHKISEVPGGHAGFLYDPATLKGVAQIVNSELPRVNYGPFGPERSENVIPIHSAGVSFNRSQHVNSEIADSDKLNNIISLDACRPNNSKKSEQIEYKKVMNL